MRKLYGLVQAGGFCFEVFGISVGIRSNSRNSLERIRTRLPPGARLKKPHPVNRVYSFHFPSQTANPRTRRFHVLYGDEQVLARSENEDGIFEEFASEVCRYLALASRTKHFVHAGVISWKGKTILLPGASFSGKTTLVKAFLDCGATYYSDEFAVLDSQGRVHAFAKPLGMRTENNDKQEPLPVDSLGCEMGIKPARIGLILLTRYERGAGWRPRQVSGGQAVLELLSHSFSARANPDRAMTILCRAVDGALVLRGVRGEALELVRALARDFSEGVERLGE